MKRLLSGIQPSGTIHLGNYVGAIRNWINLQDRFETFIMIVDLHAITVPYEHRKLENLILEAAADNLASGIDARKTTLFVQSDVPGHTELAWLLSTVTNVGDLLRMTQFKEKAKQHKKNVNAGLLTYPILQTADIALYKAQFVPVGEDQIQHIELARKIIRNFNRTFGKTLIEPKALVFKGAKILALNDPSKKMSKSIPESYIALSDSPNTIKKKIMSAVTDTKPSKIMSPGVKNLFTLMEIFSSPTTYRHFDEKYRSHILKYEDLKKQLAQDVIAELKPIQIKREKLLKNKIYLRKILRNGAYKARVIAQKTLKEVKQKMGL